MTPDFAGELIESDSLGSRNQKQAERKTKQFCREVQRALNIAFTEYNGAGDLGELFAEEVQPAPDCGRLVVYVAVPSGRPVDGTLQALHRAAGALRSEVARAITRKRAPELCFVPMCAEGGGDV